MRLSPPLLDLDVTMFIFEKNVLEKHFKRDDIELKLIKKGIFLSSMKKNAYLKNTDKCKSLFF